jgi:MFS family permease
MATQAEQRVVNAAGVVQGIALVTFPAASTIFTDPSEYDLSSTQYGALFLPQVITAITAALLGAELGGRIGVKRVYLVGLSAGLLSMVLLLGSSFVADDQGLAYPLLLLATASLGAGFGFTVPALNTLTSAFNPGAASRAVLVLNALLGLGTVLAPVFVAVFDGLGAWWGLPLTSSLMLVALLVVSRRLPLRVAPAQRSERTHGGIPARFWLYAGFAVLYGICETVNGNWAQLDMTTEVAASTTWASLALTAFWGMVTLGRIGFAAVQHVVPARLTYHALPFFLAAVFVVIARLPDDEPGVGVLAFGLAGLGCSALLPLTISFGQDELTAISAAAAGGIIAFYQLGYGIAAFGVGPLLDRGVSLPTVYALASVVAAAMGLWSFAVARRRPSPVSLHPRAG